MPDRQTADVYTYGGWVQLAVVIRYSVVGGDDKKHTHMRIRNTVTVHMTRVWRTRTLRYSHVSAAETSVGVAFVGVSIASFRSASGHLSASNVVARTRAP